VSATSQKHFKTFERAVRVALTDLGINDWQVYVDHVKLDAGVRANCSTRVLKRSAVIRLAKCWDGQVLDYELLEAARHESLHVALANVASMGGARFVTADEMEAAEESTVQRFLRCVRWSK
jgi:hypothetical protein